MMGWLNAPERHVNIDDQQAISALRMDVDMINQQVGKVEAAVHNVSNQGVQHSHSGPRPFNKSIIEVGPKYGGDGSAYTLWRHQLLDLMKKLRPDIQTLVHWVETCDEEVGRTLYVQFQWSSPG